MPDLAIAIHVAIFSNGVYGFRAFVYRKNIRVVERDLPTHDLCANAQTALQVHEQNRAN
jgi:hypothetical protein